MALATTPDIGAPGLSPSSTSLIDLSYDVFLSFHVEDCGDGFIDDLDSALRSKGILTFRGVDFSFLRRKGILTFKVDEDVHRMKKIIPSQIRDNPFLYYQGEKNDLGFLNEDLSDGDPDYEDYYAIKQSRFAIVVLSERYFSTPGCLEQLLAIIEFKYNEGQTIFPVFYDIDPSDVRHQGGSVAAAFEKHEARFAVDKVQKWREASAKIAYLPGWDTTDWHVAEIVEEIVKFVRNKLYYKSPYNFDHPVGDIFNNLVGDFQSKVDKIISLSKIGLDDISFVGICGMDGLGKTTLARGVYEAVHSKFDASCFLSNIKEVYTGRRFEQLQMMLLFQFGLVQGIHSSLEGEWLIRRFLRNNKVLIILDDVNDKCQLETLAGSEEWFGQGSKILITTRDESLLTVYKQFEIYKIEALNRDESLKLFCQVAFIKNEPEQGYLDLSEEVIKHAHGVPLHLEALGLFLCGKTQSKWRETLDQCRKRLPRQILDVHCIIYEGLNHECQEMFLDFACFFNGRTKFEVADILKTFYHRPMHKIGVLIAKSLLISVQSTSNSRHNVEGQDMHDGLQKMRSDVSLATFLYDKLPHETAQESLYMHNFLQEMGRKIVYHEFPTDPGSCSRLWNIKAIDCVLKGTKGTFLVEKIVVNLRHPFKAYWHPECFSNMRGIGLLDLSRVELAHNINCLPRALKFLRWDCYALESLPPFDQLHELESLQLRSSSIQRLWDRAPELRKLTTVDLSNSHDLEEAPDFSGTPNLEMLFFNYCKKLTRVHESVGQLKKLAKLSLRYCTNLKTLPTRLDMDNLELFILGECSKLEKLPEFTKNMRRLYLLDVMNTKIIEIPLSIINLENLKYLDLSGCCKLKSIPLLPPNSIIRANKDPFVPTTLDLLHLIESRRVSKHPIHLVVDSKVKEEVPPWFEQQELHHAKDDSSEVVVLTEDIPSDLANSVGECLGIAVCIIFKCLTEEAWRRFTINWKFQDCSHTNDNKGGRSHQTYAGSEVDTKAQTIHSKTIVNNDPQAEIGCRVYKGFFPIIDKKKCRQHPSGGGRQVDLTLRFPSMNAGGKVNIVHSKETSFGDLEVVDCGWRLVCEREWNASSARVRHEAEIPVHLVGDIQSKVDRIISLLKMELNDTCFIGIWGESGTGKTTLARLVCHAIQNKFDATCFLDNVREDLERVGIVSLQKKLLSGLGLGERDIDNSFEGAQIIRKFLCHKKVLIILDDVGQRSQLENLAGNQEWFGVGSKIVITTRDKTLLTMYEKFEEYEVGRLHPDESLKLLCLEAFKKDEPQEGYLDLSKEIIEHACRLPLVLKVLGSFLCKKDKNEWNNTLERLRQYSPSDISSQLHISYDGLENEEYKRIFLDIACFFNGEPKFKVTNILELCGHHGTSGIEVLIEKSMLNVTRSNSKLWQNAREDQDMLGRIQNMRREIFLPTYLYDWLLQEASKEYLYMSDLLQVMGRNIVFQESANAGSRSRLWSREDINDVLQGNKEIGNVESVILQMEQSFEADWHPDCFSNMKELRVLDLSKVHLSDNLNSLPSALKIMRWDYYALESLPPVGQLHELESLQLCNSKIRKLWNGAPALDKLRIIDLSDSECLETPDFRGILNLEELLLNRCRKLVQVHESVGQLKKLVKLNLQECRKLESLPTYLETDNLAELILSGCLKLEKLPEFGRNMGSLYFLDVRGTDITEIPLSIIHLSNLKCLDLTFCSRLKSIPELPPNVIISASNCSLLEPTSALPHLYASCTPKGPIHLFYDFQLWTRIPTWFEQWEYCWGKDTSGEFVTISADIPSNVVADSNEEHWGIAVCVVFQFLSKAWLGFSVNWKFEDNWHPKKTKINGTPAYYMHDCRVYIGFYPFEAKDCRQHASGEGSQLDLTLEFPATNIIKDLHDLEIMGCGWRLACKKDFDEWNENRAPSPLRLDFLNRDRGESIDKTITERKGKRKHQEIV